MLLTRSKFFKYVELYKEERMTSSELTIDIWD